MTNPDPVEAIAFYALDGERRKGPFSREDLETGLADSRFDLDTWVWHDELLDWVRLAEVLEVDTPVPPEPEPAASGGSRTGGVFIGFLLGLVIGACGAAFLPGAIDSLGFTGGTVTVPDLPVEVSFRPAMMHESRVARFTNIGERTLSMEVVLIDQSRDVTRDFRLVLQPGQTSEIGWMEGWAFVKDEQIHLSHPEFKTKYVTVP